MSLCAWIALSGVVFILCLVGLMFVWPSFDLISNEEANRLMTKYKPPGWKPRGPPSDGESG